jgi:hypothetical protein
MQGSRAEDDQPALPKGKSAGKNRCTKQLSEYDSRKRTNVATASEEAGMEGFTLALPKTHDSK